MYGAGLLLMGTILLRMSRYFSLRLAKTVAALSYR